MKFVSFGLVLFSILIAPYFLLGEEPKILSCINVASAKSEHELRALAGNDNHHLLAESPPLKISDELRTAKIMTPEGYININFTDASFEHFLRPHFVRDSQRLSELKKRLNLAVQHDRLQESLAAQRLYRKKHFTSVTTRQNMEEVMKRLNNRAAVFNLSEALTSDVKLTSGVYSYQSRRLDVEYQKDGQNYHARLALCDSPRCYRKEEDGSFTALNKGDVVTMFFECGPDVLIVPPMGRITHPDPSRSPNAVFRRCN